MDCNMIPNLPLHCGIIKCKVKLIAIRVIRHNYPPPSAPKDKKLRGGGSYDQVKLKIQTIF